MKSVSILLVLVLSACTPELLVVVEPQAENSLECEFKKLDRVYDDDGFISYCEDACCFWTDNDYHCVEQWCLDTENDCGWKIKDWDCWETAGS